MDHFFSLNSGALFIADTGVFYSLGISKISNFKKSIIWKGVFPLIEICPNKLG